jgi:hypothetical protein
VPREETLQIVSDFLENLSSEFAWLPIPTFTISVNCSAYLRWYIRSEKLVVLVSGTNMQACLKDSPLAAAEVKAGLAALAGYCKNA